MVCLSVWYLREEIGCSSSSFLCNNLEDMKKTTTTIRRSKNVVQIKRHGNNDEKPLLGRSLQVIMMGLVVLVLGCAYITVPSLIFSSCRQRSLDSIEVWDGVLSESAMEELRQAFVLSNQNQDPDQRQTAITFPWPTSQSDLRRRHRIEQILSDIIAQLYPQHKPQPQEEEENNDGEIKPRFLVEYWDRQDWISVEAHADQDENNFIKALNSGEPAPIVRHPRFGHVLYLHQDREALLRAPTLLFANASTGGEITNQECDDGDDNVDDVELFAVPNFPGRLLRFDGRLLHAVPRPGNQYIQGKGVNRKSKPDESDILRSVALFNVWPIDDPPDSQITKPIHNETVLDTLPLPKVSCYPRSEWKELSISSAYEGGFWERFFSALLPFIMQKDFNIPLMGIKVQRGLEGKVVHLKASSSVENALTAGPMDSSPKRMYLEQSRSPTWEQLSNQLKKQQNPSLPKPSSLSEL